MTSSGEDDDADCIAMANVNNKQRQTEQQSLQGMLTEDPEEAYKERLRIEEDEKRNPHQSLLNAFTSSSSNHLRGTMRLAHNNNNNNTKNVSFAENATTFHEASASSTHHHHHHDLHHYNKSNSNRKVSTRKRLLLNPRGHYAIAEETTRIVLVGVSGELVISAVQHIEENEEAVLALLEIIERGSKVGRDKRYLVSAFLEKIGARNTLDNRNNFVSTDKYQNQQQQLQEQLLKQQQLLAQQHKKGSGKGVAAAAINAQNLMALIKKKKSFAVIGSHRVHRRTIATQQQQQTAGGTDFDSSHHLHDGSGGLSVDDTNNNGTTTRGGTHLHRSGDIVRDTAAVVNSSRLRRGETILGEHGHSHHHHRAATMNAPNPAAMLKSAEIRDKKKQEAFNNDFINQDDEDKLSKSDKIVKGFLGRLSSGTTSNNNNMKTSSSASKPHHEETTTTGKPPLFSGNRNLNTSNHSEDNTAGFATKQQQQQLERIYGFINFNPRNRDSSFNAYEQYQSQQRERSTNTNKDASKSKQSQQQQPQHRPHTILHQHVLLIDLHSACRQETSFSTSSSSSSGNTNYSSGNGGGGGKEGGGGNGSGGGGGNDQNNNGDLNKKNGGSSSSTASNLLVSDHRRVEAEKARARKLFSLVRATMISNPDTPIVLLARGPIHTAFDELWSTTNFTCNPFHVEGCALDSFDLRSCRPEDAKGVAIFTTHDGQIDEDFDTMAMLVSRSVEMLRRKKSQVRADYQRMLERAAAQAAEEESTRNNNSKDGNNNNHVNNSNNNRRRRSLISNTGSAISIPNSFNNQTNRSSYGATSGNSNFLNGNNITTKVGTTFSHRLTPSQIALLKSEVPKVTTIIAFTQADSTSLLPPFAKPRSLLDDMAQLSPHYVPSFLAGRVLTSQMIESLLYFNFFSTSLLDVVKCMLNVQDYEGMSPIPRDKFTPPNTNSNSASHLHHHHQNNNSQNQNQNQNQQQHLEPEKPAFGVMPIPENCTTWRDVRWNLRVHHPGYQAIALYRLVRAIQSDEELAMIKLQQKRQEEEEEDDDIAKANTAAEDSEFDDCDEELSSEYGDDLSDSEDDELEESIKRKRRARKKAERKKKRKSKFGDSTTTTSDNFGTEGLMLDGKKLSTLAQQQLHQAMLVAASRGFESTNASGHGNGVTTTSSGTGFGGGDNDEEDEDDDRDDSENVSKFMLAAKKSYKYRAKLARQAGLHSVDTASSSERALRQDLRFVYLNPQITTELVASDLVFFLH